jgi:hypothetical protein
MLMASSVGIKGWANMKDNIKAISMDNNFKKDYSQVQLRNQISATHENFNSQKSLRNVNTNLKRDESHNGLET